MTAKVEMYTKFNPFPCKNQEMIYPPTHLLETYKLLDRVILKRLVTVCTSSSVEVSMNVDHDVTEPGSSRTYVTIKAYFNSF
jgi:hypothetical protein